MLDVLRRDHQVWDAGGGQPVPHRAVWTWRQVSNIPANWRDIHHVLLSKILHISFNYFIFRIGVLHENQAPTGPETKQGFKNKSKKVKKGEEKAKKAITNTKTALDFFRDIPTSKIRKLYQHYRHDFEIFGYSGEEYLNIESSWSNSYRLGELKIPIGCLGVEQIVIFILLINLFMLSSPHMAKTQLWMGQQPWLTIYIADFLTYWGYV